MKEIVDYAPREPSASARMTIYMRSGTFFTFTPVVHILFLYYKHVNLLCELKVTVYRPAAKKKLKTLAITSSGQKKI